MKWINKIKTKTVAGFRAIGLLFKRLWKKVIKPAPFFLINLIFLIFEAAILGFILLSAVYSVAIPIALVFIKYDFSQGYEFINKFFFMGNISKCANDTSSLIALWGIFLSCIIGPIIGFIVSSVNSYRAVRKDIINFLAETDNIKLYLLKFPGAHWYDLLSAYQRDIQSFGDISSHYCYGLHLFFKGKLFQTYQIRLREVGCIESNINIKENTLYRIDQDDKEDVPVLVTDSSGVANNEKDNIGTNISVLYPQSAVEDRGLEKILFSPVNIGIYFDLRFDANEPTYRDHWRNFCGKNFEIFRLIKTINKYYKRHSQNKMFYRVKLWVNNYILSDPSNENCNQFEYHIYDVDIERIHRIPLKPKNAKKRKS